MISKKEVIWIFVIFALIQNVRGSEPLPTTFYGKVLDKLGEPASGIEVMAQWTDSDGTARETKVKTLAISEAESQGDKSLAGFYFFNEGYIKASPGSPIRILINNFPFETIKSTPGYIVKIQDAILSLNKNPGSSRVSSQGPQNKEDSYEAQYPSGTDDANNYAPIPYLGPPTTYFSNSQGPTLPTNVYGKIMDGNPTASSSKINPQSDVNENPSGIAAKNSTILNQTSQGGIFLGSKKNDGSFSLKLMLALACFAVFFVAYKISKMAKKAKNKEKELFHEAQIVIEAKIRNFMTKNVKTVSDGSPLKNALEQMVVENLNGLAVTRAKGPIGFISEEDIIYKVCTQEKISNIASLKVADLASPAFTIGPDATIAQCFAVITKNNARKLVVAKGNKIYGIITVTDLLKYLYDFYSNYPIESLSIPTVRNVMTNEVCRCEKESNLLEICSIMSAKKADYCLVEASKRGIVTSRDIINELYKNPLALSRLKAENVMSSPVLSTTQGVSVFESIELMQGRNIRRVAVTFGGKFVGILSQLNLFAAVFNFYHDLSSRENKKK